MMFAATYAMMFRVWGQLQRTLPAVLLLGVLPFSLTAQNKPEIAGDYTGTLGPLRVILHIKADAASGLGCTLDSPNQNANGLGCADVRLEGNALSFSVPVVHGSWKGTVSADGKMLTGTWDQGSPTSLIFTRDTYVQAEKPSRVDGIWLGTLQAGGASLRIQLHVKSDNNGQEYCSLDSLDQHAMGLECDKAAYSGDDFSFDVPVVKGHFGGKLSADANTLSGAWSQNGNSLPLTLARQANAIAGKPAAPPRYDPAMPPVHAAELKDVLDKDLASALKSGELAPSTGAGVVISVVDHGVERVFSYGTAKTDSIFEIGSITKTFTGLILSQMVEQGKVKFDDPVRELLPPGTVAKPAGAEITLLDLATQHSGLPRMPDNFKPGDPANPYVDYRAANLYEFLAKHGVAKSEKTEFLYSNLGFGLLGQGLSTRRHGLPRAAEAGGARSAWNAGYRSNSIAGPAGALHCRAHWRSQTGACVGSGRLRRGGGDPFDCARHASIHQGQPASRKSEIGRCYR